VVSARKVAGRPAYARARRGEEVWLAPRPVDRLALAVERVEGPIWQFAATVSTGAYIRALVRDWAGVLGHAAHLVTLTRTGVGPFDLAGAQPVPQAAGELTWVPWHAVWEHPVVEVDAGAARHIRHGRWPPGLRLFCPGPVALARQGRLLAIAAENGRFARVFGGVGEGDD
jgi:tRNA pseudouridine55 synthase